VNNLFLGGAKVVEAKTGERWETLMQKRIFKPLEMVNSSVDGAGFENSRDKATMHILVGKKPLPIRPGDATFDWPYIYGPAGGLNSSANDMAKWLIAQMNGGAYKNARIFSKETARYMHTPITPVSMGKMSGAYCQGWMEMGLQNTTIIWHNGNALGSKAFIGFSPKLGVGLVILTNLGSQSLPDALAYQFFDMLSGTKNMDWSKELLPDSPQAEEAVATTPILEGFTLASYAGKYDNPVYGEINVAAGTDFLSITLGARQQFTIKAKHISMHLFSGDFVAISPATPEFDFEFVVDKEGRVRSLIMPELNAGQIGTFVRR
jgi:dihydroxyacetone kinase DhaKLM complex PTS-EIIA-like component DhaM